MLTFAFLAVLGLAQFGPSSTKSFESGGPDLPTTPVKRIEGARDHSAANKLVGSVAHGKAMGLGASFVGIPSASTEQGVRPLAAFGLPFDGLGSVWWIRPDGMDLVVQRPGKEHEPFHRYGREMSVGSDYDGDGERDLLVSAPGTRFDAGKIFVVSPASGAVLHVVDSGEANLGFGLRVIEVPDQDADGVPDMAVYSNLAPEPGAKRGRAQLDLYSTASGELLRTLHGDLDPIHWSYQQEFMVSLSGTGEQAFGCLVLGGSILPGRPLGAVDIKTGELIWEGAQDDLGSGAVIPDRDGDGIEDLLVMGLNHVDGHLRVRSGRTGVVLQTTRGWNSDNEHGVTTVGWDDFDGDDIADYLVNTQYPFSGGGVRVISGANGKSLHQYSFSGKEHLFWNVGWCLDVCPDMDGGGKRDLCVSSYVPVAGADSNSSAIAIVSAETGELLVYACRQDLARMIEKRDGTGSFDSED